MSKNFDDLNLNFEESTGAQVFNAMEQAAGQSGQQGEASPQEKLKRANLMKTQGRKGCRAKRINLAFSPNNYEYIAVMSRVNGVTMTRFINDIIDAHRTDPESAKLYNQIKEIMPNKETIPE